MSSILDEVQSLGSLKLDRGMSKKPGPAPPIDDPQWRSAIRKDVSRAVGEHLRKLRTSSKLTANDLSEIVGVPRTRISAFENGKALPDLITLFLFANAFGMKSGELVEEAESAALEAVRARGRVQIAEIRDTIDKMINLTRRVDGAALEEESRSADQPTVQTAEILAALNLRLDALEGAVAHAQATAEEALSKSDDQGRRSA